MYIVGYAGYACRRTPGRPGFMMALLALLAMAGPCNAAAEKYLVLSLVGNQFTLVSQERSVGSRLDRNKYETVPIAETFMDDAVLLAAKGAILKLRPDATVEFLRARDPKSYVGRSAPLDQDSPITRELTANLAQEVAASPGVRLLLVAPLIETPRLKGDEDTVNAGKGAGVGVVYGTGRVSGMGYYTGSGVAGVGIFVNMQLAVIDLQNGTILAREKVQAGVESAASPISGGTAKAESSANDRIIAMQALLSDEIARAVPALFRTLKP